MSNTLLNTNTWMATPRSIASRGYRVTANCTLGVADRVFGRCVGRQCVMGT